jgi:threonine/homoserine/homoserine lactone efflux protein
MFPWQAFLPYIFIMAITPGPNNIMTMNFAAKNGFKGALPFNFGVLTGAFVLMILCAVFSSLLFALIPRIQFPMKILGASYMMYLAIKSFLPSKSKKQRDSSGKFLAATALQFINPKGIIYGITAMSSFILPWYTSIPILVFFAFLLAFLGFVCCLCWSAFGSLFNRIFSEHSRILNIVMALLLVYCAISLFL